MVGQRATKRLADAAWNRLKGFGVLPALLGGTGLDTSVSHRSTAACRYRTWRPISRQGAGPAPALALPGRRRTAPMPLAAR
jgi:hypothetical protein